MLPCTPFAKFCLIYSSSARLDQPCAVQIHLIGIRDTPDNCSVRYRELSLYEFTLWGRESPYYTYRGFFKRKYMRILSIGRCPYREVRL